MPKRLSGAWFKWVEQDGFYLGLLLMCEQYASIVDGGGTFTVARGLPSVENPFSPGNAVGMADIKTFLIAPAYQPGAIYVVGITPEEIETEANFAFQASLAYLRGRPKSLGSDSIVPAERWSVDQQSEIVQPGGWVSYGPTGPSEVTGLRWGYSPTAKSVLSLVEITVQRAASEPEERRAPAPANRFSGLEFEP